MSYLSNNLMDNENIISTAKITNYIFLPGIISILLGITIMISIPNFAALGSILFLYSIFSLVTNFIYKISTELAVTNKRVIAKVGFIKRETIELNHNKVESFSVDQSILGRILNYGNLIVRGTGGVQTPIKNIDNPLAFRKSSMSAVDTQ